MALTPDASPSERRDLEGMGAEDHVEEKVKQPQSLQMVAEPDADDDASSTRSSSVSAMAVLRRNPDLVKAMIASGLQRSALMVSAVLGIQNLRALEWGTHTAEYTARLSMCINVVAMISAGTFGRMGDKLGRRGASAIFGITSFLPSWTLLIFGFNKTGLYMSCVAFVLSGVGLCSDALLVLANDVTCPEDRAMAFGLFQAFTNGLAFLFFGLPSCFTVMFQVLPNPSIDMWLWYNFSLTALYFGLIYLVRMPPKDIVSEELDSEEQIVHRAPRRNSTLTSVRRVMSKAPLVREMTMAISDPNMRRLFATGILLAFSGDVVFDLGSQYFRDNLDLIPANDLSGEERMAMLKDEQRVSVLTTLPPELGVVPGAMVVAYLAKLLGSKRLLQLMIPVAACMTASGAIMKLVPRYWLVPIICLFLNYASLASNVPLKHLLAAAAPGGRTGEAMATLGMLNQLVSFVANAIVMVATPILYDHMRKPLWIAYLFAGAITLMGSFSIIGLKVKEPSTRKSSRSIEDGKEPPASPIERTQKPKKSAEGSIVSFNGITAHTSEGSAEVTEDHEGSDANAAFPSCTDV